MKLQSYTITQGRDRAPARAMLKAIGFTDEDLKKPIIGVANTWIETMPCNYNLRELATHVKAGIRAAGGTPMEFNTIAISDGVTMGTEGMKASLVSRDLIADSIELVGRGHMFDGIVALVACDKTIPGAAMALLRLNVPGVVMYGGTIMPGPNNSTVQTVFEAVGQRAANLITDAQLAGDREYGVSRRRRVRRTIHRQHHGDRDGDDRAFSDEHRLGAASRPAQAAGGVPLRPGGDGCGARRSPPALDRHSQSLRECDRVGGRHRRIHQCGAAPARDGPRGRRSADHGRFPDDQRAHALMVDLKPAGRFVAYDVDQAGGWAVVAKRLSDGGFAHGDTITVTGRTFAEEAADAKETPGQEVIRPLANPIKSSGGLVILKGNLAPEGSVIKVTGIDKKSHRGPARLFAREEDAMHAVTSGEIKAGDVVVVRYEGPRGGPGMREMLGVTSAIVGAGLADRLRC